MPPPPTPLKRPSLALKRDSSYLDTDDEAGLSTSTKKLRVTFNPNVDVRVLEDADDKSYDLVKEEVHQAIERHLAPDERKDDTQYAKILQILGQNAFSGEALSPRLLRKYVVAVDTKISRLGQCGKLVSAVLDLLWVGRDETFVEAYTKVLCDIASAHGKYLPSMMESLVSHFVKLPASLGRLPEETPVPRTTMFARVHLAIRALLRAVPSASSAVMRAIRSTFPNDLETTRSYLQYQKHLIRLSDELPELKAEILALVIQKLVGTDVQVQQDIEDMEEETEEKLMQRPSSKDGNVDESDDSDLDSVSESEETTTEAEQRLRELRLKVAKMDGTLDLLFEYYTPLIEDKPGPQANDAYSELMAHFSTFILPNRCRHAQFLQFHFSQSSPANSNVFMQKCLQLALKPTGNSQHRLTACAYLASFVARGAHLSSDSVRDIFSLLCNYLNDMRLRYEPACRGPDRRSYSLYYAIAQALLYIFCFKWRDLVVGSSSPEYDTDDISEEDALAEGHDLTWLSGIQETLRLNIHSKLNPLKVCSPSIVNQFAKIAHHLRFLYIFSLLEANKRVRLGQVPFYYGGSGLSDIGRRETAFDRKTGEAHHQLEAYFPFDPYHLPRSKRWVANDYNEWKLPRGMQKDDEDDESESEEEYESDEESVPEAAEHIGSHSLVSASS